MTAKEALVVAKMGLTPLTLAWVLLLACCLFLGVRCEMVGLSRHAHHTEPGSREGSETTRQLSVEVGTGHQISAGSIHVPSGYFTERAAEEPGRPALSGLVPAAVTPTPLAHESGQPVDRPVSGPAAAWSTERGLAAASQKGPAADAGATQPPCIAVGGDGAISANVKNRPLGEVLRLMSEKRLFEIAGTLPGGTFTTSVTTEFSGLSLSGALGRLMTGYNYAIVTEEASHKRVLMVLSEARRADYAPAPQTADAPAFPGQEQNPIEQTEIGSSGAPQQSVVPLQTENQHPEESAKAG